MTDIVERLRALAREYWQHRPHYDEAADEIERLRAERNAAVALSDEWASTAKRLRVEFEKMRDEIERLLDEIKRLRGEAAA